MTSTIRNHHKAICRITLTFAIENAHAALDASDYAGTYVRRARDAADIIARLGFITDQDKRLIRDLSLLEARYELEDGESWDLTDKGAEYVERAASCL